MSAPGMDPQVLAQALGAAQNGNGAVAPLATASVEAAQQALLNAIDQCARLGAAQQSGAEAKDWLQAAKNAADAYVVLDPAVDGTGVPLGHQVELERVKQEGQLRLEEARAKQAAPAQERRKRRLRRTADGYEMEG